MQLFTHNDTVARCIVWIILDNFLIYNPALTYGKDKYLFFEHTQTV